jgi:transcriptional regulator with XRE-family HTH domain
MKWKRIARELSGPKLALEVGCSPTVIQQLETGTYAYEPNRALVMKLAEALDVAPPDALFEPVDVEKFLGAMRALGDGDDSEGYRVFASLVEKDNKPATIEELRQLERRALEDKLRERARRDALHGRGKRGKQ